ncbi:MAG TPA: P-loop NTPase fold protein [Candidatus Limnocylindrales bacterium]
MTTRRRRPFSRAPAKPADAPGATMPPSESSVGLGIDEPISSADADFLDRARFARSIAAAIERRPEGGVAYAIVGAQGSGRSSVLRMISAQLTQSFKVIDFNPWYFSGSGDLTGHFLRELASEMSSDNDKRLQSASDHLRSYSMMVEPLALLPFVGGIAKAGQQAIGLGAASAEYSKRFKEKGIYLQRQELHAALHQFDVRIVVVVDDIDRLTDPEIAEVARLVRLVGHLPRISYLLAFERERVESALGSGRGPAWGSDYLAKVVQSLHDLPEYQSEALGKVLDQALVTLAPVAGQRGVNWDRWRTARTEVVLPLLRTPRDAVRLAAAVAVAIDAAGGETAFADVVAAEARRLLGPAA